MKKSLSKILGPGLLFTGAAISVSHLVQATRAGADFGFGLLWALLTVSFFKYPFFQFGPRYANATGETLLDGYKKLGKNVLITYFILNFVTMFTIQAAVTIVTASLASSIFGFTNDLVIWTVIILGISIVILNFGKCKLLDNLMKYLIIILTISTIVAVIAALFSTKKGFNFQQILPSGTAQITFLIAFLGWMPAPLDVSIWHSLWSVEKSKTTFKKIKPKYAVFDFNVSYIATFFLGVCFVVLGALVMYQSGESFSNKGNRFALQLINLYTENLGDFSYLFIGITTFTTMFSTTLTTLDASPRAMTKASNLLFVKKNKLNYSFWIFFLAFGTFIILNYFLTDMGFLVKIATILSFLTAPFYAILNYVLITGKHTPKKNQPKLALRILSIAGIIFLIGFSLWFLINL
ncbi:Nramp family divalent metal transporter [Tenacibaculum dicentrarchi]|nr:Nramp family divalent metal transporter [Tenacibaculum dicentrarchi]MCD8415032.1 Nramp family divalent metal transporter [Tenacibaculum dicentrarchi]MCD8420156.1 Nramp family divalent metal transporter [Tenacibaculum dicentrarchi]MCD8425191.1 Nramp family divalent metal transporter [Tenacibaculum dicentrarchi]MCD8437430.1 Nramp family divalent metal transporter [Tenacibaculum dicentrarchi]